MNSVEFCSERPPIVLPLICSADSSEVVNGEDATFKGASDHFCRFSLCAYLKPRGLRELRGTNREALFPPRVLFTSTSPIYSHSLSLARNELFARCTDSPPPPSPSFPSGGLISPPSLARTHKQRISGEQTNWYTISRAFYLQPYYTATLFITARKLFIKVRKQKLFFSFFF